MKWTQVDVVGPETVEEAAIACLVNAGCSGVQVIRKEDLPEYDQEWGPTPAPAAIRTSISLEEVIVRGYLPDSSDPAPAIREALGRSEAVNIHDGPILVSTTTIEDPGWSRSWRKYFRPARVGKRLVVAPSWAKYRARKNDLVLLLDPGMAFGTGQHGTTRLCLEALEQLITPSDRVVDVGCGSGILSLAAARLGATEVLALDTDCVAIETTRANTLTNNLDQLITTRQGSLAPPYPPADIVIANILAPIVIQLAPAAAACLAHARPGRGILIASGIVRSQEGDVREALAANGLGVVEASYADEWTCLVASIPCPT